MQVCFQAFLPPVSAVEVIESSRLSVRLCVCPSVSTLMTEPFDVQTRNLTSWLAWTISRSGLMAKVIGQGHQVRKCDFQQFYWLFFRFERHDTKPWPIIWCQDVLQCHSLTSCGVTKWCHLVKRTFKMPDTGGAWTLRRFHFTLISRCVLFGRGVGVEV